MLRNNFGVDDKIDTLLSRSQIPIIDLANCGTEEFPVKSVVNRVAVQLRKALNEKGIAFIVNHGISEDKLKVAWSHLDDFCQLPTEVKELYIRQGDDTHGYVKPCADGIKLRHAFNICTLSVANLPEEPLPGFREHIAELVKDFKALSKLILQAIAISLDLQSNYFVEYHSHMLSGNHDNETSLRLLYYPPIVEDDNKCELIKGRCKYTYQRCAIDRLDLSIQEPIRNGGEDDEENNGEEGPKKCNSQCDYGTFTLLSQDSEGGLEVKLPESDKWKRVGHLPGAIIINTGEILARWTQDRYPALRHRVVIPEQACIRSRGRHSMAFFCHPDHCTEIKPLDIPISDTMEASLAPKKTRSKSFKNTRNKIISAYQLVQKRFNRNNTQTVS